MSVPGPGQDWPLVGRDAELGEVAGLLRRAERNGVVVAGEAGVGKSAFVDHCLAIGEEAGFATVRVLATQASSAIPLGALAPLLDEVPTAPSTEALAQAAAVFRGLAHERPLLLAVDDAHLLDDTSTVAIHQTVLAGDTFVLAAVRSGEPAPDAIRALWKDRLTDRLDLAPLGRDDVEELLHDVLGDSVDPATVRTLFEVSAGNPLYLRELVLAALDVDKLRCDDGLWRLEAIARSPRLVELVAARLADLDDGSRRALEYVAFGEPLDLDRLQRLVDLEVLHGLDERALLRIVTDAGPPRVRLAHPLQGEVLRAEATPLRAMAISRRLAELYTTSDTPEPEHALRVSLWMLDSVGPVSPEVLVTGAEEAQHRHDWALAERLSRAAHAERADLGTAVLLARSLVGGGRYAAAAEVLEEATRAVDVGAEADATRWDLAATRAWALFWDGRIDEALRALSTGTDGLHPTVRARLEARRALATVLVGRLDALEAAESLLGAEDPSARVDAATAVALGRVVMGRPRSAARLIESTLTDLTAAGQDDVDRTVVRLLGVLRAVAAAEGGALEFAAEAAAQGHDESVEAGSVAGQAWFAWARGRVHLIAGRLDGAAAAFAEGGVLFRRLGRGVLERWCQVGVAMVDAMRGDQDAAERSLQIVELLGGEGSSPFELDVARARAAALVAEGDGGAATAELDAALAAGEPAGAGQLGAVAYDLARFGRPDAACALLDRLATAVEGELAGARRAAAHALAAAEPDLLVAAADRFEELGCCLDGAELLAHASAATREAGDARGAEHLSARCVALVRRTGGARTPALRLAGEAAALTAREREIAGLAASGLTNPEIAERLSISVRTVANQLQRAYTKLGINSRTDLAEALDLLE